MEKTRTKKTSDIQTHVDVNNKPDQDKQINQTPDFNIDSNTKNNLPESHKEIELAKINDNHQNIENNEDTKRALNQNDIIVNVDPNTPEGNKHTIQLTTLGNDEANNFLKEGGNDGNDISLINTKKMIEICLTNWNNYLIIIILACIFSSSFMVIGILLLTNFPTILGKLVIGFGVVCILVFVYGLWSFYKYCEKVKSLPLDPNEIVKNFNNLDESNERIFIDIFIYFLITVGVAIIILSVGCIFFQDEMRDYIISIIDDKTNWIKKYGENDWTYIIEISSAYMYSVGGIGLSICIIIGYLSYLLFLILGKNGFWIVINKYISILFYIVAFLMLYAAVYTERYREVAMLSKSIPFWVSQGLYGIGISCIVIGIIGFLTAFLEKRNYLFYFGLVIGVLSMIVLVFSLFGVVFFREFQIYFQNNWFTLIDYIHEDYLKNHNICEQKYDFNSTSLRNMSLSCPKNRVSTIWEINLDKYVEDHIDLYGCFNYKCCLTLTTFILSKIQYAVLLAFILFSTGILKAIRSTYIYLCDEKEENRESKKMYYIMLGVVGAITLIVVVILISLIPESPIVQRTRNIKISKAPSNNTQMNDFYITKHSNISIQSRIYYTLLNNQTLKIIFPPCSQSICLAYRYYYEISSFDGTFLATNNYTLSNTTKQKNLTEFGRNIFSFYSYNDTLPDNWLEFFDYNHKCPLSLSYINLLVSITAYNVKYPLFVIPKRIKRTLQNSSNSSSLIFDLTILSENQTRLYYNESLDFSLVNKKITQIVIGNVYRVGLQGYQEKLDGANINITSVDFPQCNDVQIKTINGFYKSPTFYAFRSGSPTNYKLQAHYGSFPVYTTNFIVGGLAPSPIININDIYFYDPSLNPNVLPPVNNNSQNSSNTQTQSNGQTTPKGNGSSSSPTNTNSSVTPTNTNNNASPSNTNANNNSSTTNINSNVSPSNTTPTTTTTNSTTSTTNNASSNTGPSGSTTTNNTSHSNNNTTPSTNNTSSSNNTITNNTSSINSTKNNNNQPISNNTSGGSNTNTPGFSVNTSIINSITNIKIPNAVVYLYEGNIVLTNEKSSQPKLPKDGKLLSTYNSDNDGNLIFPNLQIGSYSVISITSGFYREIIYFSVIGPNTKIGMIDLTPTLDDDSLRFVLSWESSPKDLDIHTIFQVSRYQLCGVYFAMKQCGGTVLDSDNNNGGQNGVEAITISPLGNYIYTVAVNKYIAALDPSVPVQWQNIPLYQSKAKVTIYAPNYMDAIKIVTIPMIVDDTTVYGGMYNNSPDSFDWWMIVCFDGSIGVDSIVTVNKFKYIKPTYKDCSTILKG